MWDCWLVESLVGRPPARRHSPGHRTTHNESHKSILSSDQLSLGMSFLELNISSFQDDWNMTLGWKRKASNQTDSYECLPCRAQQKFGTTLYKTVSRRHFLVRHTYCGSLGLYTLFARILASLVIWWLYENILRHVWERLKVYRLVFFFYPIHLINCFPTLRVV